MKFGYFDDDDILEAEIDLLLELMYPEEIKKEEINEPIVE